MRIFRARRSWDDFFTQTLHREKWMGSKTLGSFLEAGRIYFFFSGISVTQKSRENTQPARRFAHQQTNIVTIEASRCYQWIPKTHKMCLPAVLCILWFSSFQVPVEEIVFLPPVILAFDGYIGVRDIRQSLVITKIHLRWFRNACIPESAFQMSRLLYILVTRLDDYSLWCLFKAV